MKKMIAWLLALILPACAGAETVAQQVAAPITIQTQANSPSGHSHVVVDARVYVPDVSNMGVYQASSRTVDGGELKTLADHLFGAEGYTVATGTKNLDYVTPPEDDLAEGYRSYRLTVTSDTGWIEASYMTLALAPEKYLFNKMEYRSVKEAQGTAVPPEEKARALADSIVAAAFPEFSFWDKENTLDFPDGRNDGDYGYRFYYARLVEGVPVSYVRESGGEELYAQTSSFAYVTPYEKLYVDVGENGAFSLCFSDPLCIGQRLSTVELLPFSQVMEVFCRIAPLTIASLEDNSRVDGEYSNNLYINEIRLGYMCTLARDEPGTHQLIPVWDFYGTREYHGDLYNESCQSLLTISAVDGTVIDRGYGY